MFLTVFQGDLVEEIKKYEATALIHFVSDVFLDTGECFSPVFYFNTEDF